MGPLTTTQNEEEKTVRTHILHLVLDVARSPEGSETLVQAKFWDWLVDAISEEGDEEVKTLVFQCLGLIKAGW